HPHGNQNMYLVNINRSFNLTGRVVPYVGVGLGGESWYAGPKLNVQTTNENEDSVAIFTKYPSSETAFAFNLQAGAKIYLTNAFGVRADFSNVMSFPEVRNTFRSIDVSDFQGFGAGSALPLSGSTRQSARFNQAIFSGGVFWALGGRMDAGKY